MARKKIEKTTFVDEVKVISGDKVVGFTPCEKCGKPSTYMTIDGEVFCSLSCETNK